MMRRRFVRLFGTMACLLLGVAACGGGEPAARAPNSPSPNTSAADGVCSLISRDELEKAFGPLDLLRNDKGPITADAVRGSCDYLRDETHFERVFFTINVMADPSGQMFSDLSKDPDRKELTIAGVQAYEIDRVMYRLVAHKSAVTFDLGLNVGANIADNARDHALAKHLLEQAMSHF